MVIEFQNIPKFVSLANTVYLSFDYQYFAKSELYFDRQTFYINGVFLTFNPSTKLILNEASELFKVSKHILLN